ncbi:MAG TPA: hypothetical protein VLZ83_02205 [Edaphocola sp.]|nr:hypothetical protein [Edaphocola sp.]
MFNSIRNYIINYKGYKTDRKLVVFLVDDYGSILNPSDEVLQKLKVFSPIISENRFNKFDDIASANDLNNLFEVLISVKDKNNNPAVFTPLTVVANPDFDKIKNDNFQNYHYESFYQTIDKKEDGKEIKALWENGIRQKIFMPEFHGREHFNVRFWMDYLRSKDKNVLEAFLNKSIGIRPANKDGIGYMAAFDLVSSDHLKELEGIVQDGLNLFEKLFGYRAVLFTPPGLLHNDGLNNNLKKNGISFIDMARLRKEPDLKGRYKKRYHYMGQKNKFGQQYLTRNVMFEPNMNANDWVGRAMNEISVAFQYKKPAIISSHRVNFVGGKSLSNRDKGLKDLKDLLSQIVKRWPDVEFMAVRDLTKLLK